jgi:hypothetical protein
MAGDLISPLAEETVARTVLARKGSFRRPKSRRALAHSAPFWQDQIATGGSGGMR